MTVHLSDKSFNKNFIKGHNFINISTDGSIGAKTRTYKCLKCKNTVVVHYENDKESRSLANQVDDCKK